MSGGKLDEKGASIGWNISKRIFRAMIDSALGLDPNDMSDAAKTKRQLRGLADLGGIAFVAKITVEASDRYGDKNRLDRPVLPNEKEWALVMEGKGSALYLLIAVEGVLLAQALPQIWDPETQALFAAVMSFWFGNRALQKARGR